MNKVTKKPINFTEDDARRIHLTSTIPGYRTDLTLAYEAQKALWEHLVKDIGVWVPRSVLKLYSERFGLEEK